MAIKPIEKDSIQHRSNHTNYICDLCGMEFRTKHDAKEHHKSIHISDKITLDNMISKVYRKDWHDGDKIYRLVLSIDYEDNSAKVIQFSTSMIKMDEKCGTGSVEYKTNYIDMGTLKYMHIYWVEVPNGLNVLHGEIERAMDCMLDNLAISTGDLNGNRLYNGSGDKKQEHTLCSIRPS